MVACFLHIQAVLLSSLDSTLAFFTACLHSLSLCSRSLLSHWLCLLLRLSFVRRSLHAVVLSVVTLSGSHSLYLSFIPLSI